MMNDVNDTLDFLAKLTAEAERLDRLAHLLHRKRVALRDARTRLRLGVDPQIVSLDIIKACREELVVFEHVLDVEDAARIHDIAEEYAKTLPDCAEHPHGGECITWGQP